MYQLIGGNYGKSNNPVNLEPSNRHALLALTIHEKGNDNKCHPRLGDLVESQNKIHIIGG